MTSRGATLVVSFGTSVPGTLERNIAAIEREIAAALPDMPVRRAFTSGMILRKLARRDGVVIDDVPQALDRLYREGYRQVVVQPTHIINGDEFEKLCAQASAFDSMLSLRIGTPLLTELEDYFALADALMESLEEPGEGEALVLMGHGSGHYANAAYPQLEYVLQDRGWSRAFVGTVEGYPGFEEVLRRLRERPDLHAVHLHPLMVVAGDHATCDMAGPEASSWRARLEAEGYAVRCTLRGLGEYAAVRRLFARHAVEEWNQLKKTQADWNAEEET